MVIRFERKSKAEWLVLFILAMPFTFFLLTDFLGLPSLVKYTVDVAWIVLLLYLIVNRFILPNTESKKIFCIVLLYFAMTVLGVILEYQSVLYYLWGLRNNFRFFVFFFACILFLKEHRVERCFDFLEWVYYINFAVTLFQFFAMGKRQDYLGGLFGVERGCNAYSNIFIVLVVSKSLLYCLHGKERFGSMACKTAIALLIAIFAELKVFFVEIIAIVFLALGMTRWSMKKLGISVCLFFGVGVAMYVLVMVFPEFYELVSLPKIWELLTAKSGYTMSNDMNRLTTVSISLGQFLNSWNQKLFGLGLGNCEHATFSFLQTPFYDAYKSLHYMWFSSAMLILETGIAGMAVYIAFFVVVYLSAGKREKQGRANILFCQLARITAVMSVVQIVYNSSMRTEAAYMLYFALALPFLKNSRNMSG